MLMSYDYECMNEECGLMMEVEQDFHDKPLVRCPACKKHKLERVHLVAPIGFVEREPTTLGQLSDRNMKKAGKEQVKLMAEAQKRDAIAARAEANKELQKSLPEGAKILEHKERETPWYGDLPDKVKKASPEKIQKYVMTGDE
jgi:putative FmdB family regulatory protein